MVKHHVVSLFHMNSVAVTTFYYGELKVCDSLCAKLLILEAGGMSLLL